MSDAGQDSGLHADSFKVAFNSSLRQETAFEGEHICVHVYLLCHVGHQVSDAASMATAEVSDFPSAARQPSIPACASRAPQIDNTVLPMILAQLKSSATVQLACGRRRWWTMHLAAMVHRHRLGDKDDKCVERAAII